jgi:DHA1 family tetracycline resistance protein-like MFS transporter
LAFIFVTVLVDSVGFGIILPVLPRLIMNLTGVTVDRAATYGGLLASIYALTQFFCAPVLGNLSDHFGRRPVLLFSLFALGCDYFIQGLAPTIAWLFVGRTIAGVAGASFTPAYACVATSLPRSGGRRASASWVPRSGSASSSVRRSAACSGSSVRAPRSSPPVSSRC